MAIRDVLDRFCRNAEKEMYTNPVETDDIMVAQGHPVHEIIRISEEKNCDLIVMGRHGYGAIKDVLMGGVAKDVLRRSLKPVLLVRLVEK